MTEHGNEVISTLCQNLQYKSQSLVGVSKQHATKTSNLHHVQHDEWVRKTEANDRKCEARAQTGTLTWRSHRWPTVLG